MNLFSVSIDILPYAQQMSILFSKKIKKNSKKQEIKVDKTEIALYNRRKGGIQK